MTGMGVNITEISTKFKNSIVIGDFEREELDIMVAKNEDGTFTLFCNISVEYIPDVVEDETRPYNIVMANLTADWEQPPIIEHTSYSFPEESKKNGWIIELLGLFNMQIYYYGIDCNEGCEEKDGDGVYDSFARSRFKYYYGEEDYPLENSNFDTYVIIAMDETIEIEEGSKTIRPTYLFPLYENEFNALKEDESRFEKIFELYPDLTIDINRPEILFDEEE